MFLVEASGLDYPKIPIIAGSIDCRKLTGPPFRMSSVQPTSSLVITLSKGSVGLDFVRHSDAEMDAWRSSFQVDGLHAAEQVSGVLDIALLANPILTDRMEEVLILMVDSPSLLIQHPPGDIDALKGLAAKYLRRRAGDQFQWDTAEGKILNIYTLPEDTFSALREYYAEADILHLTSIIWTAIHTMVTEAGENEVRMNVIPYDHYVLIIGTKGNECLFCKTFYAKENSDAAYYALACSRLLQTNKNILLTIKDEPAWIQPSAIDFPVFHEHIELPALRQLIASHLSCVS